MTAVPELERAKDLCVSLNHLGITLSLEEAMSMQPGQFLQAEEWARSMILRTAPLIDVPEKPDFLP